MIALSSYLMVSALLFGIGTTGIFINRKSILTCLMSIELILLSVSTNFIAFSRYFNNMTGQIFVFFILTVAAAETAVGLALLVLLFKERNTIRSDELNSLQG